jgi:hypothetical protein
LIKQYLPGPISANAAAGIYSESDNKESESDVDDIGPIKVGTKRKSKGAKNTGSHT